MDIEQYLILLLELVAVIMFASVILLFQEETAAKVIQKFENKNGAPTIKTVWRLAIVLALVQSLAITVCVYAFLHGINISIKGLSITAEEVSLFSFFFELIAISCINASSMGEEVEYSNWRWETKS